MPLSRKRIKNLQIHLFPQPCWMDNKGYNTGDIVYDDCSTKCTCEAWGMNCEPVCPDPTPYPCFPGTTAQYEDMIIDIGSEQCRCPSKRIKILGSMYVSGKLTTYPSPRPTFCPKWEEKVNVWLGEGKVVIFPEKYIDPDSVCATRNVLSTFFILQHYRKNVLAATVLAPHVWLLCEFDHFFVFWETFGRLPWQSSQV